MAHSSILYVLGMGSYNSTFFTLCICPRKNWQSSIQALTRCAVDGRQKLARSSFWTWPSLHVYRTSSFFKTICPLCLNRTVGVTPANIPIFKHFSNAMSCAFLIVQRLILLRWKAAAPPTHDLRLLHVEKTRCTLARSTARPYKAWQPFLKYTINKSLL